MSKRVQLDLFAAVNAARARDKEKRLAELHDQTRAQRMRAIHHLDPGVVPLTEEELTRASKPAAS